MGEVGLHPAAHHEAQGRDGEQREKDRNDADEHGAPLGLVIAVGDW